MKSTTEKRTALKTLLSHTLMPNSSNHKLSIIDRCLGGFSITVVFTGMFAGPLIPFGLLWLLVRGYHELAVSGLVITLSSMYLAGHSPGFCRFLLRSAGYFTKGVTVHNEAEMVTATANHKGSMWCMHPHGTSLGFGFMLNGAVRYRAHDESKMAHPKIVKVIGKDRLRLADGVQAPVLFRIPILRSIMMGCGCCTPATKSGMFRLFRANADFGILPGGMEEVALYKRGRERVYVKKRAGFIKYALQHGYLLIPCYTFGESDLYNSYSGGNAFRMWILRNLGFVIPVFWGPYACYGLPWLPRSDIAINTVVGKILQLPKIENPSNDEVSKYHQLYMTHLTALFDAYKTQFGYGDRQLEIL